MYRAERASHVYKKKTLNVNDELNIKHDEDDLENVDEYWTTAVSMIGNQTIDSMDDTVISTQSDTLFNLKNIRQSLKSNLSKGEPTGKAREAKPVSGYGNKVLSKKRLTLKPEEDGSEEYVDISMEPEQKENKISKAEGKLERGVTCEVIEKKDSEAKEYSTLQRDDDIEQSMNYAFDEPDSFLAADEAVTPKVEEKITDVSNAKHTNNKKEEKEKMARSKLVFSKNKAKKSQESIVVQNIKSVSTLNKIRPLVCTNEINTAIMELDFLAYTNEESSEKAFSIFVLRGNVEIQTKSTTASLKKGEATVVGEGDVYSLSCKSKNGASLFLSYAL
ncbi:hypothetical protein PAEPH01_0953 [Pancytospora epiphaga]|nr:hypothetical protein PAEPH01_0953 [Pancytospora epiphaga]